MNIKQEFLTPNQYTRPQIKLQKVTKIAVHYAGDPGATAQNMHDYFNGTCISAKRYASCHYTNGLLGEIIQLIPETEWSYCTNQANGYSISIETCHPDATGKFTQASEKSLIELVASLCKKYGLNPLTDVIRHYDVTKKCCPKYYVDHPAVWAAFKTAVANCMAGRAYTMPTYGTTVGVSTANTGYCDTTCPFTKKVGEHYTFKTGSPIVCGNDKIFKNIVQKQSGGYYFTEYQAVGKGSAGFYLNGAKKAVVVGTVI